MRVTVLTLYFDPTDEDSILITLPDGNVRPVRIFEVPGQMNLVLLNAALPLVHGACNLIRARPLPDGTFPYLKVDFVVDIPG